MNMAAIKINSELSRFDAWSQMSSDFQAEVLNRSGQNGLPGVLTALDTIFDLGCPGEEPKVKPQVFGKYPDDYRLIGNLYDSVDAVINGKGMAYESGCNVCFHEDHAKGVCKYPKWKSPRSGRVMPLAKAKYNCPMIFSN